MKKIVNFLFRNILPIAASVLAFSVTTEAAAQLKSPMPLLETENYGPVGLDGSVIIMDLKLAEIGDSLLLAFYVHVNDRAMNNRQSWRIVPELASPTLGEALEFPSLLIAGRQKDRHFRRKERFENRWLMENYPEYMTSIPKGTDTVLTYRVKVPYEIWMDDATLDIRQYLASPKERRHLFTTTGYGRVELEPRAPYAVDPRVNYIEPDREVKKRSAVFSSLIDFPVGVSRILPDFRRNPEELRRIDHELSLINENPYIEVEAVFMEGHASPEGSLSLNERLSSERVESLKRYFVERHGISPQIIRTAHVTEDWEGLRAIVGDWDEGAARDAILAIVDGPDSPNVKEQKLRTRSDWSVLIRDVFPRLRRTEYRIDYRVNDFSVEESRALIGSHPDLFSHYELYSLAMSYRDDPTRRLEVLETILRYFPDDEVAIVNYAAELINRGEIATARRWMDKVTDPSISANNRGVIHLLDGEYEAAEALFEASRSTESIHNLRELRLKKEDDRIMKRYENR